jgi:hypothetical protein
MKAVVCTQKCFFALCFEIPMAYIFCLGEFLQFLQWAITADEMHTLVLTRCPYVCVKVSTGLMYHIVTPHTIYYSTTNGIFTDLFAVDYFPLDYMVLLHPSSNNANAQQWGSQCKTVRNISRYSKIV